MKRTSEGLSLSPRHGAGWAEPWVLEKVVFGRVELPLNLKDNRHPFGKELGRLRREQGREAREELRGRGLA